MVQLFAFRRSLQVAALALCAAVAVSATPASARSHRGIGRHLHRHHFRHHPRRGHRHRHRSYRHAMHRAPWDDGTAQMRMRGLVNAGLPRGAAPAGAPTRGFGSSNVVAEARRYIGGNPTSRRSLWCARFMNMVLQRSGHRGTGSDAASSFAHYGHRVPGPRVGAIAVMTRRGGGHVGVVSGINAHGNPILVSGNNRNRVVEAPVSRRRIYAYVVPTG
jgi:uncharacterized protein (TIGR02594 family)